MERAVEVPEGVDGTVEGVCVTIKGDLGEIKRCFNYPGVAISKSDKTIKISGKSPKRRDIAVLGTIQSHLDNMISGVQKEFVFNMTCVYAHFPMSVKVQGSDIQIQNFLGERNPRKLKVSEGVKVVVNGDEITLSGINKELVAQAAGKLEKACYKGNRDPRKFQDGIYPVGWHHD